MGKSDVTIRILGDPSGAQKAFAQVENSAGGFGSRIGGATKAIGMAFAGAGLAAGAFGAKAIMAASDLNETLSKTQVVFGEATKQVTGFADEMADKFGLPKRAILDAAGSFGLIAKASGLAQAPAAKMSTELAKLAADASSFYNVPLEEALLAIQSGLVGEAEPMRRFGVLLNEAAVKTEALTLGLVKQGEELTEGHKAQARASLIMKGMKDASGDLERTQGSFSNRLREVRGRVENFAAAIGTKLLPFVLKGMDLFQKFADAVGYLGGIFANAFKAGDTFGLTGADGVEGKVAVVGAAVRDVADDVRDVLGRMKVRALEAFDAIKKWWDDHGPKVIAVLEKLRDTIKFLAEKILEAGGLVMEHWDKFRWAAGAMASYVIGRYVAMQVAAAISAGKQAAAWVIVQAAAFKSGVLTAAVIALMIADWVRAGVAALVNAAKVAFAWVISTAGAMASAAVAAVAFAIMAAGWIKGAVIAMANATIMAAAWFVALGPIAWVIAAVIALGVIIWRNWDTIKRWTSDLVQWLKDRWEDLLGFFKAIPGRMSGLFSGMFDGIKNAFKSAINWVIDKWNALDFKTPSVNIPGIGKVGGGNVGVPDIPRLAKGGIVTHPTLALIGEAGPEAVVPLSNGGGVGGPTVVVQGNVYGGRDFLDYMIGQLEQYFSRGGAIGDGRGGTLRPV